MPMSAKAVAQEHSRTELTEAELHFLRRAASPGILAYQPRQDAFVKALLRRGYLSAIRCGDADFELLILTEAGRASLGHDGPSHSRDGRSNSLR